MHESGCLKSLCSRLRAVVRAERDGRRGGEPHGVLAAHSLPHRAGALPLNLVNERTITILS